MIKYILVDDDESVLRYVKSKIDSIAKEYELKHLASFNSSKKANDEAGKYDFDLLIVDYEMPVFNGVELAKRIASSKKVIFLTSTTNNEQNVINSVDIVGFLSKPFDVDAFVEILKNKLLNTPSVKSVSKKENHFLPIGNSGVNLKLDEIYYVSTIKTINGHQPKTNYINFYGKNDALLIENVRYTIKNLATELKSDNFEKINQSTLINNKYLKRMDRGMAELYNSKEEFDFSTKDKQSLLQRLKNAFS